MAEGVIVGVCVIVGLSVFVGMGVIDGVVVNVGVNVGVRVSVGGSVGVRLDAGCAVGTAVETFWATCATGDVSIVTANGVCFGSAGWQPAKIPRSSSEMRRRIVDLIFFIIDK